MAITEPSANRGRLAESIKTLRGQMLLLAEFDECMVECDGRLCDAEREVGVQNPNRGGANAPPSLFLEALSRAAPCYYLAEIYSSHAFTSSKNQ